MAMHFTRQLTYRDFPPGGEVTGGAVPGPEWHAAIFSTADETDPREEANFDAFLDMLNDVDPYGLAWCVVSYTHWHVGLVQFVFTNPADETVRSVVTMAEATFEKMGVLDQALYLEYKGVFSRDKADKETPCPNSDSD